VGSTKCLSKLGSNGFGESIPYPSSCSVFISDCGVIVGISYPNSRFFAFHINSPRKLLDIIFDCKNDKSYCLSPQSAVYHVIYSPKSKSIITIGTGIFVWSIDWQVEKIHSTERLLNFSISLSCSFLPDYSSPLLQLPSYDYQREQIYLPSTDGVIIYDLQGNLIRKATIMQMSQMTLYSFNPISRQIIVSDPIDGLSLWSDCKSVEKRFSLSGSSVISMIWIDVENVLVINSNHTVFILNTMISKYFFTYDLQNRPTKLIILDNRIYSCHSTKMTILEIHLFWKSWMTYVNSIARLSVHTNNCEKQNLVIMSESSTPFRVISLESLSSIGHITLPKSTKVVDYLYDLDYDPNDTIMLPFSQKFYCISMGKELFVYDHEYSLVSLPVIRASSICLCFYQNQWCIAVSGVYGIVSMYRRSDFGFLKKIMITKGIVQKIYFDYSYSSMILILNREVLLYNMIKEEVVDKIPILSHEITSYHNGFLVFGSSNGRLDIININSSKLEPLDNFESLSHLDRISSLSFYKPNIWMSTSIDGILKIWNCSCELICSIQIPFQIESASFLNEKLDILIALKTEIMLIKMNDIMQNWVSPSDSVSTTKFIPEIIENLIDTCPNTTETHLKEINLLVEPKKQIELCSSKPSRSEILNEMYSMTFNKVDNKDTTVIMPEAQEIVVKTKEETLIKTPATTIVRKPSQKLPDISKKWYEDDSLSQTFINTIKNAMSQHNQSKSDKTKNSKKNQRAQNKKNYKLDKNNNTRSQTPPVMIKRDSTMLIPPTRSYTPVLFNHLIHVDVPNIGNSELLTQFPKSSFKNNYYQPTDSIHETKRKLSTNNLSGASSHSSSTVIKSNSRLSDQSTHLMNNRNSSNLSSDGSSHTYTNNDSFVSTRIPSRNNFSAAPKYRAKIPDSSNDMNTYPNLNTRKPFFIINQQSDDLSKSNELITIIEVNETETSHCKTVIPTPCFPTDMKTIQKSKDDTLIDLANPLFLRGKTPQFPNRITSDLCRISHFGKNGTQVKNDDRQCCMISIHNILIDGGINLPNSNNSIKTDSSNKRLAPKHRQFKKKSNDKRDIPSHEYILITNAK